MTIDSKEYGPKSIAEVSALSVAQCALYLNSLTLGAREEAIAGRVLKEVQARIRFLLDVGLEYLSLARAAGRSPVARRSGSDWRRRSGRVWRVCCTCWTNRRSVFTSATTAASSTLWCVCATWQHADRRRT